MSDFMCPQNAVLKTRRRFRERVVLANALSFRLHVPGEYGAYVRSGFLSNRTSECTFVPAFVPRKHPLKTFFFENHPFVRCFLMVPPRGYLFLRFYGYCALKCEK